MKDLENERDNILIEEREKYEQRFLEEIVDEMIESDDLDRLIAERFKYIDENFEFEPSPAYERLEEIYFAEHESKFREHVGDVDDYIDYPDGPDENLDGIKREMPHEIFYEDFEPDYNDLRIEIEIEKQEEQLFQQMVDDYEEYLKSQPLEDDYAIHQKMNDFNTAEAYEELIQEAIIDEYAEDERYMDALIQLHIAEEKRFLEDIMTEAAYETIFDEAYFERAIDEHIFSQIDIDYEPDLFDYDDRNEYWYDQPDESVIDPFDSFGEIDYPEGEPIFNYNGSAEASYQEELQRDFEEYQRRKNHLFGYSDDELQEPDGELILDPPKEEKIEFDDVDEKRNKILIENREKIELKFKDYFTKDDTLDRIIKEKLKEKKFNKL